MRNENPEGLGGWLILPIIGLFVSPIIAGVTIARDIVPLFMDGSWEALTTPGGEVYHKMWAPLLIYEGMMNTVTGLFAIALMFPLFMKLEIFPRLMIAFYMLGMILLGIDEILYDMIPEDLVGEDTGSGELVKAVLRSMVWITYFMRSERVSNTFIH